MAKEQKQQTTETSNSNKKNEKQIVVDLQLLLTPLAIFVTGIMLTASILYSGNLISGNTNVANNNNNPTGVNDVLPTALEPQEPATGVANVTDDPFLGNKETAKVAIIEFSDFECPFCQRFHEQTFDSLIEQYVDTGEAIFVYKDFPLSFHDPVATEASNAAECVNDQVGSVGYFEFIQDYYKQTVSNGAGLPAGTTYESLASKIDGIDINEFNLCVSENRFTDEIAEDLNEGTRAGVTGTPGFLIGQLGSDGTVEGIIIPGAQPLSSFQQVIDEQLAK